MITHENIETQRNLTLTINSPLVVHLMNPDQPLSEEVLGVLLLSKQQPVREIENK